MKGGDIARVRFIWTFILLILFSALCNAIDTTPPNISFVWPTLGNNSYITTNSTVINVSSADESLHYTFLDYDRSLIGWYRGDDMSGSWFQDLSGYGNNLFAQPGATNVSGCKYMNCMNFSSAYANSSSSAFPINPQMNFSLSFWMYLNSYTGGNPRIIRWGMENSYEYIAEFLLLGGNTLWWSTMRVGVTEPYAQDTISYSAGVWYHLVGVHTYDGSNALLILYRNGVNTVNATDTSTAATASSGLRIGVGNYPSTDMFKGKVDELLVFNRSLSAREVKAIYNASVNQYINNFSVAGNDTHTFKAYAVDVQGNMNYTDTYTFTRATGPVISISSPQNNAITNISTVNFSASIASSSSTNATFYLYYGNLTLAQSATGTFTGTSNYAWNVSLDMTAYPDDTYTWKFGAVDVSNISANSSSYQMVMDRRAPAVGFAQPTPENTLSFYTDSFILNTSSNDTLYHYAFLNYNHSLVGVWRGENSPGDTLGIQPGSWSGQAQYSQGRYGSAFSLSGSTYIAVSNLAGITGANPDISISAWAKPASASATNNFTIIDISSASSTGQDLILYAEKASCNGNITVDFYNSERCSNITLSANQWVHIVLVRNSSQNKDTLYVNGTYVSSVNHTGLSLQSPLTLRIGTESTTSHLFNGLIDDVIVFNRSITSDEIRSLYNATLQRLSHNFTTSGQTYHNVSVYAVDGAGNINVTSIRQITVNALPVAYNVSQSINDAASLDPGVVVSISANITDLNSNFAYAVLQWRNSTGISWTNISMVNVSGSSQSTNVSANITLPNYEDNLTYRILAVDGFPEQYNSSNSTINSAWDCTWNVTPTSVETTFGFDTTKRVANLTIFNTGDTNYSYANGCEITLTASHNLGQSKVYFNYSGNYKRKPATIQIDPGENLTVGVDFRFASGITSENLSISFTDALLVTESPYINVSGLMISTSGPYLYQEILTPTSNATLGVLESVYQGYLTPQRLILNSSIWNGIGDDTPEKAAYNVTFNWTFSLPFSANFTNLDSTASATVSTSTVVIFSYPNISDGASSEKHYNAILAYLNSSSLEEMQPGSYNFSISSSGYNQSGSIIQDASGNTLNQNSIEFNFSCFTTADGVCVEACLGVDPDCYACGNSRLDTNESCDGSLFAAGENCTKYGHVRGTLVCSHCNINLSECTSNEVAVQQASTSGGSSGGGGGGGGGAMLLQPKIKPLALKREDINSLFQTSESYEIVRGSGNNFNMKVENSFDAAMEHVMVSVTGFLSQYIDISPAREATILPNESINYTISINAPEYFTEGVYELNFTITALLNRTTVIQGYRYDQVENIQESRFVTLSVLSIPRSEASGYLSAMQTMIGELNSSGFKVKKLNEAYAGADSAFKQGKLASVKLAYDDVRLQHEKALDAKKVIVDTWKGIADAKARQLGQFVKRAQRMLLLAQAALERGDFAGALDRANDAKVTLTLETVGRFSLYYFFITYWRIIVVAFALIAVLALICLMILRYYLILNRIRSLNNEKDILIGLIKQIQLDCFKRGSLSMEQYYQAVIQYEDKINRIVNSLIELENKRSYHMKWFTPQKVRIMSEKAQLLNLIRETQNAYIRSNRIETKVYESRMKSYTERLAELEENYVNIQVREEIKNHALKSMARFFSIKAGQREKLEKQK